MRKLQLTRQEQKNFKTIVDNHINALENKNEVRFDCFEKKLH